jgi:hypothetical protein
MLGARLEEDTSAEILLREKLHAVGPQPPPRAFGGEKALKNLLLHLRVHGGRVVHPEHDLLFSLLAAHRHGFPGRGSLQSILEHIGEHPAQNRFVGDEGHRFVERRQLELRTLRLFSNQEVL